MSFCQFCFAVRQKLYYLPHLKQISFSRVSYLKHILDAEVAKKCEKRL